MGFNSLEISHFRNLHSAHIEPDAGLNLITGDNAAGKTSLLESIFYLSYGRSFRNSQVKHLISYDHDFFRLITELDDSITRLGIERNVNDQKIRVNQTTVSKLSELSSLIPVIALHPDSHQLISAGPENRRQYLDWGVFHVEHQFLESWKLYKKALSQRNASLRLQQSDKLCSLWNTELVQHAENIERLRLKYLDAISDQVRKLSTILFPGHDIDISYKRGLPVDIKYADYLQQNLHKDKEKGFTQSGPHRADVKIQVDGQSAQSSISRGQQKKLVCLLKIAQLSLFSSLSERRCILLFDDLPAELDDGNQNKIMSILSELDIQLFITAIDAKQINCSYWDKHKVFHVEHGVVKEVGDNS